MILRESENMLNRYSCVWPLSGRIGLPSYLTMWLKKWWAITNGPLLVGTQIHYAYFHKEKRAVGSTLDLNSENGNSTRLIIFRSIFFFLYSFKRYLWPVVSDDDKSDLGMSNECSTHYIKISGCPNLLPTTQKLGPLPQDYHSPYVYNSLQLVICYILHKLKPVENTNT